MNKKRWFLFAGLLILITSIFIIAAIDYESSWHNSDEILVVVDGYTMTLDEAIDNNVFIDGAVQSYTTQTPNPGHNANEIWISINGNEMTLQNAIIIDSLCGKDSPSYSYSSSPSSLRYQFADEIEISSEKSLQDAINIGDFCYETPSYTYSWYSGPWGPCVDDPYDYNPTHCIQTRVVYCRRSDGQQVADSYCSGIKPSYIQDCDCPVW